LTTDEVMKPRHTLLKTKASKRPLEHFFFWTPRRKNGIIRQLPENIAPL
jgi:hypothetical protein